MGSVAVEGYYTPLDSRLCLACITGTKINDEISIHVNSSIHFIHHVQTYKIVEPCFAANNKVR